LVDYIYSAINLNVDYVLTFAAIPKNWHEIYGLDDKSELAHHVMLVNLLHWLGAINRRRSVIILSLAQLKLFSHCPPITVYSTMMVFIQN